MTQSTRAHPIAPVCLGLRFVVATVVLLWLSCSIDAAALSTTSADKAPSASDPPDKPLLLRSRTTSESTVVSKKGRRYRILVSSPKGPVPADGFPVIYVLDGDAWFGAAVEIARMREYEKLAPAVIVAIGYPSRSFFDAAGRSYDFSPPGSTDPDFEGTKLGGADEFLGFLNGTLKPWVRAKCHIDPDRQILFGHSLGGMFALYAMFKAPESFNIYLAASPDLPFAKKIVFEKESAFEASPARTKARILVSVGGLESHPSPALMDDYRRYYTLHPEEHPGQTASEAVDALFADDGSYDKADDTRRLVERLARSGVKATFVEFAGEEHTSAAISALNRGIPFALRPAQ